MDSYGQIRRKLTEVYGENQGKANYDYVVRSIEKYLQSRPDNIGTKTEPGHGGASPPVEKLAGKVFAICYPDNVYNDTNPTLRTLQQFLERYYPAINGAHILPERPMSHDDLWPQDLRDLLPPGPASDLIAYLAKCGMLTEERVVTEDAGATELRKELSRWYDKSGLPVSVEKEKLIGEVCAVIESRRRAHFNDGGFSQISRARVDPRFGSVEDLQSLSQRYALMLDYVVNHLDIDNETLEAFRRGEDDGSAFIIISPEEYERRKQNGDIDKAFRPRPFPLFTGLRKYTSVDSPAQMNAVFENAGLKPPDPRITLLFTIYFKMQNGQGLTKEELRIVTDCIDFLSLQGADAAAIFTTSEIHEGQPALTSAAGEGMGKLCELAGMSAEYAKVFESRDDEVFGEKFFVYTTFSESQADINPVTKAGFNLVVDDLFHLLSSGNLAMMRMDAVKYLWKEIGKRNFDMEEGNKLIEVIRLILAIAAPELAPLDEVNSSDQDVYRMGRDGGFAYLFGQVNAVPVAFNTGSLEALVHLTATMARQCPENLLLFVMLSTHDGRSIQGIGVDRPDGHVSIRAFTRLRKVAEANGGKVKYRSVPKGSIPSGTFEKACGELGLKPAAFKELFERDGDQYKLKKPIRDREEFRKAFYHTPGITADADGLEDVFGFLADWVIAGRAAYELCSTSRSAFDPRGSDGSPLTPVEEAGRLALAQIFILSFGQAVPAIYLNDLLGVGNDTAGYVRSGRPRDLNRHKSHINEVEKALRNDEFTKTYVSLLNAAIEVRTGDSAFRPGGGYEFYPAAKTVFLNHAYSDGHHSLVVGNIVKTPAQIRLDLSSFKELKGDCVMSDRLTGTTYNPSGGAIDLEIPGYGALWLSV